MVGETNKEELIDDTLAETKDDQYVLDTPTFLLHVILSPELLYMPLTFQYMYINFENSCIEDFEPRQLKFGVPR